MQKLFRIVKRGKEYAVQRKVFEATRQTMPPTCTFRVKRGLFKTEREDLYYPFQITRPELETKWEFAEKEPRGSEPVEWATARDLTEAARAQGAQGAMEAEIQSQRMAPGVPQYGDPLQRHRIAWHDELSGLGRGLGYPYTKPKTYKTKKEATEALQRLMWESVETKETKAVDNDEWEVV